MRFLISCGLVLSIGPAALATVPLRFEETGDTGTGPAFVLRHKEHPLWFGSRGVTVRLGDRLVELRPDRSDARGFLAGEDPLPGAINRIDRRDPGRWRSGLRHYARLRYRNLHSGIDWVFRPGGGGLEFDFAVRPGADPRRARFTVKGASSVRLASDGAIEIRAGRAAMSLRPPELYQGGRRISGAFRLEGNRIGFETGPYDRTQELLIDPVVQFVTYFGGGGIDAARLVALDRSGNVYAGGLTASVDLPVTGGVQGRAGGGGSDVFLAKFTPDLKTLVWATYLGGSGTERLTGIAVDSSGEVVAAGVTNSLDFPVSPNAPQPEMGGGLCGQAQGPPVPCTDGFLLRLAASGTRLVSSTYLGGSHADEIRAMAIDVQGNVLVTGTTGSSNFPVTPGTLRPSKPGNGDIFAVRYAPSGAILTSATLGGSATDTATAVAGDASGEIVLAGHTLSTDFPVTPDAFQRSLRPCVSGQGCPDLFITRLDAAATRIVSSTFLGGSGAEDSPVLVLNQASEATVGATVNSRDFPVTPNAVRRTAPGGPADAVIARVDRQARSLLSSTYLGGLGSDILSHIAIAPSGDFVIAGDTDDPRFLAASAPADSGNERSVSSSPAFLAVLNADFSRLMDGAPFGKGSSFGGVAVTQSSQGPLIYAAGQAEVPFDGFPASIRGPSDAAIVSILLTGFTGAVRKADLTISKRLESVDTSGPVPRFRFVIEIVNRGLGRATNIILGDRMQGLFGTAALPEGCRQTGVQGPISCSIADLATNASATRRFDASWIPLTGEWTNTAEVSWTNEDGSSGRASATIGEQTGERLLTGPVTPEGAAVPGELLGAFWQDGSIVQVFRTGEGTGIASRQCSLDTCVSGPALEVRPEAKVFVATNAEVSGAAGLVCVECFQPGLVSLVRVRMDSFEAGPEVPIPGSYEAYLPSTESFGIVSSQRDGTRWLTAFFPQAEMLASCDFPIDEGLVAVAQFHVEPGSFPIFVFYEAAGAAVTFQRMETGCGLTPLARVAVERVEGHPLAAAGRREDGQAGVFFAGTASTVLQFVPLDGDLSYYPIPEPKRLLETRTGADETSDLVIVDQKDGIRIFRQTGEGLDNGTVLGFEALAASLAPGSVTGDSSLLAIQAGSGRPVTLFLLPRRK